LMVAWALNYLYMLPDEANNNYEHALRRSYLSGVLFTLFHWPLCASLVLASAASGEMVQNNEVDRGVAWYWGAGLGFAMLFMVLIDICHRNLSPPNESRIPRSIRQAIFILGALALILSPLGEKNLSGVALLSIGVAITWFVLLVQVVGMLPRPRIAREHYRHVRENEELRRLEGNEKAGDGEVDADRRNGVRFDGDGRKAEGDRGGEDGRGKGMVMEESGGEDWVGKDSTLAT